MSVSQEIRLTIAASYEWRCRRVRTLMDEFGFSFEEAERQAIRESPVEPIAGIMPLIPRIVPPPAETTAPP